MTEHSNAYSSSAEAEKKPKNPGWNRETFANILKAAEQYPEGSEMRLRQEKSAYDYRFRTTGEPVPEKYLTKEEKDDLLNDKDTSSTEGTDIEDQDTDDEDIDSDNENEDTDEQDDSEDTEDDIEDVIEDPELNNGGEEDSEDLLDEDFGEEEEEINKDDLTPEYLRKLLKDKGVKFFPGLSQEKLYDLCVKHKLLEEVAD